MTIFEITTAIESKHLYKIPKMVKGWIGDNIFPLTIYSCRGYTDYLDTIIRNRDFTCDQKVYQGLISNDELIGFSEWKISDNTLFLNNICVEPDKRGMGLGEKMFSNGVETLTKKFNIDRVQLDVFEWNSIAVNWYKRRGFKAIEQMSWYTGPIPDLDIPIKLDNVSLIDYVLAESSQKHFGFSMFRVITTKAIYSVGRINDLYYRITAPQAIFDSELLECLRNIDSKRSILLICKTDEYIENEILEKVTSSLRMAL